ncbi:MAG: amidohydrolase family protein [Gemmatimonadaceae bacterium]
MATACAVPGGRTVPQARTALAITGVTVIDVETGARRPNQTVVTAGNRIAAIGSKSSVKIPAGATVIDGRGKFLIPGLWDMHTHLNSGPLDSATTLPSYVANGVTGIRELWGDAPGVMADSAAGITQLQWTQRLRRIIAEGRAVGPRIVIGSAPLDGPFGPDGFLHVVRTPDEATRIVDESAARGVDAIVIYRFLNPAAYAATAAAARRHGLPVAGGAPIAGTFEEFAAAGHRSRDGYMEWELACSAVGDSVRAALRTKAARDAAIPAGDAAEDTVNTLFRMYRGAHSRLFDTFDRPRCERIARAVAQGDVWQTPRLVYGKPQASGGTSGATAAPYLPKGEREAWESRVAQVARDSAGRMSRSAIREREIFRILHDAGIPLVVGTESYFGSPATWGFSVHDELVELVAIGLTPAEALRAGTLEPARVMNATDSLGTLAPGKLADLVLLDADPLSDIRNTRRVHAVVLNGRLLDRAALDAILEDVRRVAENAAPEP